jgi:type 1 fimbria pilin
MTYPVVGSSSTINFDGPIVDNATCRVNSVNANEISVLVV